MRDSKARKADSARRVGLARVLSKLGYCSRSQAAELIHNGRVALNGKIPRDPETPVDLHHDRIEVDRRRIEPTQKIYLMLNKRRGVVTSAADEKGRNTIYDGLPDDLPWVAPVGRLDMASEGLLLLTNDSEWGGKIADPETHLDKTYHVRVAANPDQLSLESLITGVKTTDGVFLKAKTARVIRHGTRNAWLEIVLDEGKNRQIRRMFEGLKIDVLRLIRVAVGPLPLGDLAKGACRPLTPQEKSDLDRAMAYKNRPLLPLSRERTRKRLGTNKSSAVKNTRLRRRS